ncbi:MAG: alpha-amylase family glycosyl hydrolase [Bacteroidetes bacterium]|nr:alpha-amylase family glycosyl hydrolase [Bacteroidota bacterium]
MKLFRHTFSFFTFILFLFFNSIFYAQTISGLIQPIHLTAGTPDTIIVSDLFYAKDYKVNFYSNKNIDIKFDQAKEILVLTAEENFEGIDLVEFNFHNRKYEIPVQVVMTQFHEFSFKPSGTVQSVNLFGTFNGWNRNNLPMNRDANGIYHISIPLEAGRYEYKYFVDGKELVDPNNPVKTPNGMGDFNSVLVMAPKYTDKLFLHVLDQKKSKDGIELQYYYEIENQKNPINYSNIIALIDNEKIPAQKIKIDGNKITVDFKSSELIKNPFFRIAVNQDGQTTNIQTVRFVNGEPAGDDKNVTLQDQIIYSIMIDRFFDGDSSNDKPVHLPDLSYKSNYDGGDFQGIIDKINSGYFDSLGVNTLWLSPVVDNPDSAYREYPAPHRLYTGYHGYWPLHSYRVEEHFGTMALLKKLIRLAHQHKMHVLFDYVAHHVFIDNPIYKKHRDWFGTLYLPDGRRNLRLWDEERLTTWFDVYLPTFNFVGSKAAREAMTDNAVWWLKETNADGFRHDAVKHIPNSFWRLLTYKLKKEIEIPEKRNIYQIGETFGSYKLVSSYVNNGQLNAQFNFNLYDVAIPTFIDEKNSFVPLANEIEKSFLVYGYNNLMGNIMDSHDKVRFMAYADGEIPLTGNVDASQIGWDNPPTVKHESSYKKLKLYLSYLLTIPGIPVIDYGDEIGMTGAADPDNRRIMRFGNQLTNWEKETLADVRKIVSVRKNNSALRYGDFQTLDVDSTCFVYLRSDMNERVLVAINKNGKPQNLKISLPAFYNLSKAVDLIDSSTMDIKNHSLEISIPAIGFKIFRLD